MLRYIEIADRGRSDWNLVSYLAIIPWGVELSAFHLVVWDVLKLWCLGEQPCRILQFCRLRMYHLPIRNGILQPGKLSLKPPEVTIIPIKPSFHPMVHHFPHCQTPCFRDIGGFLILKIYVHVIFSTIGGTTTSHCQSFHQPCII